MNKYLHYRAFDENGEPLPRRGATVAYREFPDGSLRFAAAFVHHKDNFSRRRGREVADQRLDNLASQTYVLVDGERNWNSLDRLLLFRETMDAFMQRTRGYKRRVKDRKRYTAYVRRGPVDPGFAYANQGKQFLRTD